MYLPFKPIKGQPFRLSFTYSMVTGTSFYFTSIEYSGISKDGGQFTETANAPVYIVGDDTSPTVTALVPYIDLTAAEMNADVIVVLCKKTANAAFVVFTIYTQPAELSAAPTLNSSLTDKITAIFQYLFFKRTVTATQEKLYKSDGSTVLGTGTLSDDATTFSKGQPS